MKPEEAAKLIAEREAKLWAVAEVARKRLGELGFGSDEITLITGYPPQSEVRYG